MDLRGRIQDSVGFIRKRVARKAEIALIVGTGLGKLAEKFKNRVSIAYGKIPHFPLSTAPGHKGELVFGSIGGKALVAMEGRFHFYEGYTLQEITFPVRVMRALGARVLIVSNAAGGMNPQWAPGEIMIITDHINLMGVNPLIGPNDDSLGPRFPDLSEVYDRKLVRLAEETALEERIACRRGVYVGVTGPNLETAAEYRFLRLIGADAVGMSTVPEALVAAHAGMRTLGLSVITDRCLPDALKPTSLDEILRVARESEPKLSRLVFRVIEKL